MTSSPMRSSISINPSYAVAYSRFERNISTIPMSIWLDTPNTFLPTWLTMKMLIYWIYYWRIKLRGILRLIWTSTNQRRWRWQPRRKRRKDECEHTRTQCFNVSFAAIMPKVEYAATRRWCSPLIPVHLSGYNFDAVSCESCKAFFRRNALRPPVRFWPINCIL